MRVIITSGTSLHMLTFLLTWLIFFAFSLARMISGVSVTDDVRPLSNLESHVYRI